MNALGQKATHWLYYAVGLIVAGALVRVGWEVGGRIWRML